MQKRLKYILMRIKKILADYHHLLNKHLNEDNVSKDVSDDEFEYIYIH